jgi:hypothetical protein
MTVDHGVAGWFFLKAAINCFALSMLAREAGRLK